MQGYFKAGVFAAAVLVGSAAHAGDVTIVDVKAQPQGGDSYRFAVTLRHADSGWDHYANQWDVRTPDGKTVLGTRVLAHPHVSEQPFTRSLGGVAIPMGLKSVLVMARDSVHGTTKKGFSYALPGR